MSEIINPSPFGETFPAGVTQFMRPLGRPVLQTTHLSSRVLPQYQEMCKAGCHFETEVLRTDEVSVTISDGGTDLDIAVIPNGPEVQEAMEKMLERRAWVQP